MAIGRASGLKDLKRGAKALEARLDTLTARIRQLEQGHAPPAYIGRVDEAKCAGCGVCVETCPRGAVRLESVARIDPKQCSGCGRCVEICPQGAIGLYPAGSPAGRDRRRIRAQQSAHLKGLQPRIRERRQL